MIKEELGVRIVALQEVDRGNQNSMASMGLDEAAMGMRVVCRALRGRDASTRGGGVAVLVDEQLAGSVLSVAEGLVAEPSRGGDVVTSSLQPEEDDPGTQGPPTTAEVAAAVATLRVPSPAVAALVLPIQVGAATVRLVVAGVYIPVEGNVNVVGTRGERESDHAYATLRALRTLCAARTSAAAPVLLLPLGDFNAQLASCRQFETVAGVTVPFAHVEPYARMPSRNRARLLEFLCTDRALFPLLPSMWRGRRPAPITHFWTEAPTQREGASAIDMACGPQELLDATCETAVLSARAPHDLPTLLEGEWTLGDGADVGDEVARVVAFLGSSLGQAVMAVGSDHAPLVTGFDLRQCLPPGLRDAAPRMEMPHAPPRPPPSPAPGLRSPTAGFDRAARSRAARQEVERHISVYLGECMSAGAPLSFHHERPTPETAAAYARQTEAAAEAQWGRWRPVRHDRSGPAELPQAADLVLARGDLTEAQQALWTGPLPVVPRENLDQATNDYMEGILGAAAEHLRGFFGRKPETRHPAQRHSAWCSRPECAAAAEALAHAAERARAAYAQSSSCGAARAADVESTGSATGSGDVRPASQGPLSPEEGLHRGVRDLAVAIRRQEESALSCAGARAAAATAAIQAAPGSPAAWDAVNRVRGKTSSAKLSAPPAGLRDAHGRVCETPDAAYEAVAGGMRHKICDPSDPAVFSRATFTPRQPMGQPLPVDPFLNLALFKAALDSPAGESAGMYGSARCLLRGMGPRAQFALATLLNSILVHGEIPAAFRDSLLLVLHKPGRDPLDVSGWRGILVMAAELRLLFKIIGMPLNACYGLWIGPSQIGFIPGSAKEHSVLYSMLLAECVSDAEGLVLLLIDVEKGYDNLPYKYLREVIAAANVPPGVARALMLVADQCRIASSTGDRVVFSKFWKATRGAGIGFNTAPHIWNMALRHLVLDVLDEILEYEPAAAADATGDTTAPVSGQDDRPSRRFRCAAWLPMVEGLRREIMMHPIVWADDLKWAFHTVAQALDFMGVMALVMADKGMGPAFAKATVVVVRGDGGLAQAGHSAEEIAAFRAPPSRAAAEAAAARWKEAADEANRAEQEALVPPPREPHAPRERNEATPQSPAAAAAAASERAHSARQRALMRPQKGELPPPPPGYLYMHYGGRAPVSRLTRQGGARLCMGRALPVRVAFAGKDLGIVVSRDMGPHLLLRADKLERDLALFVHEGMCGRVFPAATVWGWLQQTLLASAFQGLALAGAPGDAVGLDRLRRAYDLAMAVALGAYYYREDVSETSASHFAPLPGFRADLACAELGALPFSYRLLLARTELLIDGVMGFAGRWPREAFDAMWRTLAGADDARFHDHGGTVARLVGVLRSLARDTGATETEFYVTHERFHVRALAGAQWLGFTLVGTGPGQLGLEPRLPPGSWTPVSRTPASLARRQALRALARALVAGKAAEHLQRRAEARSVRAGPGSVGRWLWCMGLTRAGDAFSSGGRSRPHPAAARSLATARRVRRMEQQAARSETSLRIAAAAVASATQDGLSAGEWAQARRTLRWAQRASAHAAAQRAATTAAAATAACIDVPRGWALAAGWRTGASPFQDGRFGAEARAQRALEAEARSLVARVHLEGCRHTLRAALRNLGGSGQGLAAALQLTDALQDAETAMRAAAEDARGASVSACAFCAEGTTPGVYADGANHIVFLCAGFAAERAHLLRDTVAALQLGMGAGRLRETRSDADASAWVEAAAARENPQCEERGGPGHVNFPCRDLLLSIWLGLVESNNHGIPQGLTHDTSILLQAAFAGFLQSYADRKWAARLAARGARARDTPPSPTGAPGAVLQVSGQRPGPHGEEQGDGSDHDDGVNDELQGDGEADVATATMEDGLASRPAAVAEGGDTGEDYLVDVVYAF